MKNTVPIVPPKSRKEIQSLAVDFSAKWLPSGFLQEDAVEIDYLYDIVLPESFGIVTGYTDLVRLNKGVEVLGFTDAETRRSWVTSQLSDAADTVGQRRFRATVGHEIGHCILHVPYLRQFSSASGRAELGLCRASRYDIPAYKDPEWQAWEFGDELLMPTARVITLLEEGMDEYDLADAFNLNPGYVRARLKKLKIRLS